MRRKSKKVREETKVESSSERRSKRSSTRRKKPYDDEEGGSGVEEGRTTEEENQSRSRERGSRRYATRGRRHKVEESEEEESQNEEEGADCDEESSSAYPVVTEADDGDDRAADSDDESKRCKSLSSVADNAPGEIEDSSNVNSDNQYWEMKTGKVDQENRGEPSGETPAPGEGDDGEEEVPRSHSRKKKLKLSRECLHENREAIPKIRLRLSRNRSGGYETEKVEAERIDSKSEVEEHVVEVFKVESVPAEREEKERDQSSEPSETAVETEVVEADSAQAGVGEMAEQDTEVEETKAEEGEKLTAEEVIPEDVAQQEEEVSSKESEERDSPVVEISARTESGETSVVDEGKTDGVSQPEVSEEVSEPVVKEEESKEMESVEEAPDSSSLVFKEERVSEEEGKAECEEEGEKGELASVKEERRDEEEAGDGENQVSTGDEVEDIKKDKDEDMEVTEGNEQVPVGGAREEDVREEVENGVEEEKEGSDQITEQEEISAVGEDSVSKSAEDDVPKDVVKEASEAHDHSEQNEEGDAREMKRKEEVSQQKSGERVSRLNRSRLRQEDEKDEDGVGQKRRARRKRSHSGGEDSGGEVQMQPVAAVVPDQQPQPKRVTLKRPMLIRTLSSTSKKEKESEDKVEEEAASSKPESDEPRGNGERAEAGASPDNKEEIQEDTKSQEPKSIAEEDTVKKRRRKWGHNRSQSGPSQSKRAFISISSQSLKGLIPEVKPLPIHELRLSIEKDDMKDICMEEEESSEAFADETIARMIDTNGQSERTVWAQVVEEMRPAVHPQTSRLPGVGGGDTNISTGPVRRISIVSDDAVRLQRSPSPPRHPPSNVLFLSNLVRPFTVQQLKELLARTGTVAEDGFWIDRIKSMCLVQYETEEQARETRHALHGVRWPISNPKRLWVDFSTKDRLDEAKREGNAPPLPPTSGPSLSPPHSTSREDFPRKLEPLRMDGTGMVTMHPSQRSGPGSPGRQGHGMGLPQGQMVGGSQGGEGDTADNVWQQRGRTRPEPPPLRPGASAREFKVSAPVREWDLDKVVQQSPPHQGIHGPLHGGALEDRRRPDAAGQPGGHRDRVIPSPPTSLQEIQARKAKRKEAEAAAAAEAPANLLDSLFRKTKATPSIYWLPLTADQIKVKEEIRRQHLAEHERRMAEMKRAAAKERAGRRRRRSSSPRRRSRRRSGGEESGAVRKRPSESMKGRKTGSTSPKK